MFNIKNKNQSIKMSRSLKIFFMWPIYIRVCIYLVIYKAYNNKGVNSIFF